MAPQEQRAGVRLANDRRDGPLPATTLPASSVALSVSLIGRYHESRMRQLSTSGRPRPIATVRLAELRSTRPLSCRSARKPGRAAGYVGL